MKYLALALMFSSSSAFCALNLTPGLWSVDMTMKNDGREINPMAQRQKMFDGMPPEQKKKMMELMGKSGAGIGAGGDTQICYTKEIFAKPESFAKSGQQQQCDSKFTTQSSTKVAMTFTCKNGSSGDATWTVQSPRAYSGLVNIKSAEGKKSEMRYNGRFVSNDCGSVKPILSVK